MKEGASDASFELDFSLILGGMQGEPLGTHLAALELPGSVGTE